MMMMMCMSSVVVTLKCAPGAALCTNKSVLGPGGGVKHIGITYRIELLDSVQCNVGVQCVQLLISFVSNRFLCALIN